MNGTRLTTSWRSNEVIVDDYSIPVSSGAGDGMYQVEVGLYEPATGIRLKILDEEGRPNADHILLASLQVTRAE